MKDKMIKEGKLLEKYYVSGCKDNGSETVTCDDSEAQFWTLYARDDAGLSQGIIDLAFREDAVAAMAVYVQRDVLREQLSRYSMNAGHADQRKAESNAVRVALGFSADADDVAPCDLVDAITALKEQVRALAAEAEALKNYIKSECFIMEVGAHPMAEADISAEERMPETPVTAAVIREIRDSVVNTAIDAMVRSGAQTFGDCVFAVHGIRSGEQP